MSDKPEFEGFDTSDVDRWIGAPLGHSELKDEIHINDIRRWAQGMQNPNPLYFDESYAEHGRHGRLVAPQSFAVCTSDSHGAGPAIQGTIPGMHMIFGGDEWWFHGPRIEPGDRLRLETMLFDYKVADTKFAGPTMFSRGDTTYVNQRGEIVCKQRSTSVRYRADEARERDLFGAGDEKEWSDEELEEIERQSFEYTRSFLELGHDRRLFVKEGDELPTRPIGPHSLMTFTTEWRSYLMTVWGAFGAEVGGRSSLHEAGWLPEMSRDLEAAKLDPSQADGLYKGPSRGHVQPRYARLIGMPRGYGYGASMGAWILDYLTNWVGEWGEVLHSNMQYRAPALTGDLTLLNGKVLSIDYADPDGQPVADIEVVMTNQRDEVMAKGTAQVRLPTEALPVE
ncbi:MAG: MaoC family dehydratase N-terminal domain-containing protein [Proteobacteria bacterium]|nr:MaoC family dehydratase N-terminal domain-containing protein [Pseudomonadota bacterium]